MRGSLEAHISTMLPEMAPLFVIQRPMQIPDHKLILKFYERWREFSLRGMRLSGPWPLHGPWEMFNTVRLLCYLYERLARLASAMMLA